MVCYKVASLSSSSGISGAAFLGLGGEDRSHPGVPGRLGATCCRKLAVDTLCEESGPTLVTRALGPWPRQDTAEPGVINFSADLRAVLGHWSHVTQNWDGVTADKLHGDRLRPWKKKKSKLLFWGKHTLTPTGEIEGIDALRPLPLRPGAERHRQRVRLLNLRVFFLWLKTLPRQTS